MSLELRQQVGIVTGASSGNGRSIALAFARAGMKVVAVDIEREPRESGIPTDELINSEGGQSKFVQADVTDAASYSRILLETMEFGAPTCLVNNAGIMSSTDFFDMSPAEFDRMLNINVKSVYFLTQAVTRIMIESGVSGSVLNLSSIAGIRGTAELGLYSLTKGAIRLLTYSLAGLLGPQGIRVNALHPGVIETAMTRTDVDITPDEVPTSIPLRRYGLPGEVADAAVFLTGPTGSYINGESLVIDGGMTNAAYA